MASKKPVAMIYTEGKTDWQLLQKAHGKLNLHLDIEFYNFSHRMGDEELLAMCRAYSRETHPEQVQIFVFDRDNPKIINDVKGKDKAYRAWENNVFSFPIPIPEHRAHHESISIEFYFTDDEIKTGDSDGRRLFLSSEFDKITGSHKDDPAIHVINQKDVKDYTKEEKSKIVDSEATGVVKGKDHVALSKGKFTKYICDEVPPFDKVNFESFKKIFDIIEDIIQNEFLPSIQSEFLEDLPPRFFIGREAQFELFEKYLKRNQPISIEGLGGIGKTAFAEKCIETFGLADRAVWFPCTQDSKLDSLIEMAGFPDLLKIEKLTELAKYSGLRSLLERHEKILFLDDFQEITDPSFTKFFQFADKRLQNAKIILIAREHPEIRVLTSPIRLQGLEDENAFDYAQHIIKHNYPELNINDQNLRAIAQQVKGHPLAIELAIYLLDFGTSPEHLLQAIVEHENEEFLAHRLLDEIFTHPKSTHEEKEFMLAFSVFRGKVKEQAFKYLFEEKDVTSTVRRLRRKLMLMFEDRFYETHPLVREFCYNRLSNKQEWHKKAAEYFQSERTQHLDPVLEVMIFYHLSSSEQWQAIVAMICAKGEQFLLSGYTDVLKAMLDATIKQGIHSPQFDLFYGDIAEIHGKKDQALHYFEQAFSSPDADEKLQAQGKIQYGNILYRKGDVKASLAYFEQGYEMCRHIHFQQGEAQSLNFIGLAYQFLGNLDAAKMKIEESLKLRQQMGNTSDIATSLSNLGSILYDQGDLQGAWDKYQYSLRLCEEIGEKSGIAASLNNLGSILHDQGDLQGAWDKHQCGLQLHEEMGEKSSMAASLNHLGRILRDQGDLQGAWDKYQYSLKLCEEIGEKSGIAASLNNLGGILHDQGDLQGAWNKHQRSLQLQEEMGAKSGIATSLNNLGSILYAQGNLQGAWDKYQRSLQLHEEIGEKSGMATSLNNLGGILHAQGDLQGAWDKYQHSFQLYKEMGAKSSMATSLNNLGRILHDQGDLQGAWEKWQQSLHLREKIGDKSGIAISLHNLGAIACSEKKKDYVLALQYFFKSKILQNQIGIPGEETDDYIFEIRKKLGLIHFKITVQEALQQLPDDVKEDVDIEKFTQDTTVRRPTPKVGRNDPCPCGSGKKYKKCCGR